MLALVERRAARPNLLAGLGPAELAKVEPCLELQADHDAIELLIDAYSTEEWGSLRHRATAIMAMMVLIEVEGQPARRRSLDGTRRPQRASFNCSGTWPRCPSFPPASKRRREGADRVDPADLPDEDEVRAFAEAVALPLYRDAVDLAAAAGALAIQKGPWVGRSIFR